MFVFQLLHRNVDTVERKPNGVSGGILNVKCKDFRIIQLEINLSDDFAKVAHTIENLSSLGKSLNL